MSRNSLRDAPLDIQGGLGSLVGGEFFSFLNGLGGDIFSLCAFGGEFFFLLAHFVGEFIFFFPRFEGEFFFFLKLPTAPLDIYWCVPNGDF